MTTKLKSPKDLEKQVNNVLFCLKALDFGAEEIVAILGSALEITVNNLSTDDKQAKARAFIVTSFLGVEL